ncbi:phage head-tail adapter protein [Streptomyces sp. SID10815]|uniref:phage head completion protein n=1 Tax=Streptomyces sp. SID10815 TaxID=2706027 RepID=UPI0013C732D7|nr:phage head-tail adapter protein [Streptomyces sp. SID10815]NEA50453.1 phage head-tail adapter protein [Streptomyces sp. SID10815]
MVSVQRRRGQRAKVWRTSEVVDNRGNRVIVADPTAPIEVRAAFIPQRSARAEVPGQQQINVTRMIVDAQTEGVSLWSRVEYAGRQWDVVSPPAYHHGDRRTRHWAIDIRERP